MHTNYPKGTPLFIKLKDGSVLLGKFKDHKSGKVILDDNSEIELSQVRAMSIRKLQASTLSTKNSKINFREKK